MIKKIFLFLFIFLSLTSVSYSQNFIKGDLNSDGKIDISDIISLAKFTMAADINCDSTVNIYDAIYINDYIFGKIDSLSYCINDYKTSPPYIMGDADGSGSVNISDIVSVIRNIYIVGDLNCDRQVNQEDIDLLVNCVFKTTCDFCSGS